MRRTKRILALCALVVTATTATAAYVPAVERSAITIEVGRTRTVRAWGSWPSGMFPMPWRDFVFDTSDRRVATTTAAVMTSPAPYDVPITGVAPGVTWLTVHDFGSKYTRIKVVCGNEEPIQPAEAFVTATLGSPVLLEAMTPIAHRTTFTWYRGRLGDLSSPLQASGSQIAFVPQSATEHVWVLATTPCSSSSAEFVVTAQPKRRRVRH